MGLRRSTLSLEHYIRAGVKWDVTGPVCDLCNQVVDEESLVEGYPGVENSDGMVMELAGQDWCKVLVKHHGQEELRTFQFGGRNWGPTDLKKAMQRVRWFSPEDGGHAEEGTLSVQVGGA